MNRNRVLSAAAFFCSALASLCVPVWGGSGLDGCWSGTLTAKNHSIGITGHVIDHNGARIGVFNVPEIADYGKVVDDVSVDGAHFRMSDRSDANGLVVEGELRDNRLEGLWTIGPMQGSIKLQRCDDPARALPIREDVNFSNGAIQLAGTLVKPEGDGPFPIVVWTHGSGRLTRDSWVYSRWVNLLTQQGVASLIYDKRGFGKSTGVERTATLNDLAGDLLAGVAFAKSRTDVDPKCIGVGGISQGAWICPLAASQSRDIAFLIAESASGVDAAEQDLYVIGNRLRSQHIAEDEVNRLIDLRRRVFQYYRTGDGADALESDLQSASQSPAYKQAGLPLLPLTQPSASERQTQSRFDIDVVGVWEKVHVPVIAAWGAADRIVPPDVSRKIIAEALERAGNTNVTLYTFEGGTHLLTRPLDKNDPWRRIRVIPEWPDRLCEWLHSHVQGKPGKP